MSAVEYPGAQCLADGQVGQDAAGTFDSGNQRVADTEPFDLADLARSVPADFAPLTDQAKIRLETEMSQKLEIRATRTRFAGHSSILFDNAIKYNVEEGRIHWQGLETKGGILISLYNTGPGIPQPKIWARSSSSSTGWISPGQRSPAAPASVLPLAREIVRLHGGTIAIDSRQGLWAQVDMFLPRRHAENRIAVVPQSVTMK